MAADRFKYFRIEAREIIDGLSRGMLDLERTPDGDVLAKLLRLAHTLKGAARIVGHREIADLAHQVEDVLAPLRDGQPAQRERIFSPALALVDRMSAQLAALSPVPQPAHAPPPQPPPPVHAPPAETQLLPRTQASAPPASTSGEIPVLADAAFAAPRLDSTAVDDLLGGLAEIHRLLRRLRGLDDLTALEPRLDQLERELRGVRQDAERFRLLAAETSFTALARTARDVAKAAGKRVVFTASGGDVRVDAQVLTTLQGALVQLVRNAVAHGIEQPADRAAAGKLAEGRVAIGVALRGNRVVITCGDDGRGIDLEAVRHAAIRRGLAADRARELDRDALIRLVLGGGLTTTTEVTAYAGRGIGLDVVRDAVRLLGGEVTVRTGPTGTLFTLVVPTSAAAVSALVVVAGDRTAALPLTAVRRVVRASAALIVRSPDGLSVALDDVTLSLAPLARLLGATSSGGERAIVIIESAGALAALAVDHVIGIDDVVVRALPASAPIDPIVWGVAIDAEELPRPILEPTELIAAARALPVVPQAPAVEQPPILVVDDSLTTRMLEQSILESAGYEVDIASSAEEGLVKAAARSYGLILCDVEMPGMDGFGFIATLRSQPELASVPAILVTSRNRPDDLRRGVAVGAQGYVVKSDFDQVKLLDMIRGLVRR